jgi:asparagine synthase (glutamine-hydrolysing)
MCGLAAIFQLSPHLNAGVLARMADLIVHRGPDGEGYALGRQASVDFLAGRDTPHADMSGLAFRPTMEFDDADVKWTWGLAHRRLSILDLAATGHQPMCSSDERYVITYNGEVYNYLELKQELVNHGYAFKGRSDTEVIIAAYAHWGVGCLQRFNGMFAFVLVDTVERSVFAARDRFGVKPLYLFKTPRNCVFASEIKQFSALPQWNPMLDWQNAQDFMISGLSDHNQGTLFSGVTQIQGGHFIKSPFDQLHTAQPTAWYRLDAGGIQMQMSFEEAASRFSELFSKSVQLRLRADVPVGTALSGGLDSSSIVCEVTAQLKAMGQGAQKSFSICSAIPQYDERKFIDIVTEATGVDAHHFYPETDVLLKDLPDIVWHQDEPFAGTSIFAEWSVYKLARSQGVKVTLDGHGADEMLCGYHQFFWVYLNDLLSKGRAGQWMTEARHLNKVHGYALSDIIRSQLVMAVPSRWVRLLRNTLRNEGANRHLLSNKQSQVLVIDDPHERVRPFFNNVASESVRELTQTSVPVQLHWADRDSMAHSVESRLPFLDYRLVEFVTACSDSYKIGNGTTKRLLRKGMERNLPPQIAQRQDKMGFVTPEQVWLCDQQGAYFSDWLKSKEDLARSILSETSIQRAHRILQKRERYNRFAWRTLSMVMWAERFSVKGH